MGGFSPILTLGPLRKRVETEKYLLDSTGREHPNPHYKMTHLGNPIKCPYCQRDFVVFVGVEYDDWTRSVKDVHVDVARLEEPNVRELVRWPHVGLVDPMVVEFKPSEATIYANFEHYQEYNDDIDSLGAVSIPHNGVPSNDVGTGFHNFGGGGDGRGNKGYPPPRKIQMGLTTKTRRIQFFG